MSFSGGIEKGVKRNLLEEGENSETPVNSSYLILAAKRTYRRDPLDDFKKYTGGWNISEKHYWAVSIYIQFILKFSNVPLKACYFWEACASV